MNDPRTFPPGGGAMDRTGPSVRGPGNCLVLAGHRRDRLPPSSGRRLRGGTAT